MTDIKRSFKHPYGGKSAAEIIELACAYLPPDVADWNAVCRESVSRLNDRAKELCADGRTDDSWWMAWRACDPVHLAADAMESAVWETIRDHRDGYIAGWFALLQVIHLKRFEQYLAKKNLFLVGGAG